LRGLLENIELAKKQPVPQCAAVNGAFGLIGKCLGYNEATKVEVTNKTAIIAGMTDAELRAMYDAVKDDITKEDMAAGVSYEGLDHDVPFDPDED
jgi:hypothetical protein